MIKLTQFLTCFCFFQLSAQSSIQLNGIVLSKTKTLNEVHVYNSNTFKGVITNIKGEFSVLVKEQDVLVFSMMTFSEKKITITQDIINDNYLKITLNENINDLDEVVVTSHNLTGSLLVDSKLVPQDSNIKYKVSIDFSKIDFSSIPDTGSGADRGHHESANNMPTGGNILGLVGLLVDVAFPEKYVRPKPRTFTKASIQVFRKEMGDDFFIKELQIPKSHIDDFLDEYCSTKEFIDLYEENKIIECIELLYKKNELQKYVKQ